MKKSIVIDVELIDAISDSTVINDKEKINFLKFIWYLTFSERRELETLI